MAGSGCGLFVLDLTIPSVMPAVIARVLGDPAALVILVVLLAAQGIFMRWCTQQTKKPLTGQRDALRRALPRLNAAPSAREAAKQSITGEVACALHAAFPANEHDEVLEPRAAFDPEHLLPGRYNARLDTAAPGLFTAFGILGTFLGLVVAFFRIDFTNPVSSIPQLMGAMTLSFVNSLFGVSLSVWWTVSSRRARHDFDVACREVLTAVEERFGRPAHGTQILGAFAALQADTKGLREDLKEGLGYVGLAVGRLSAAQQRTGEQLENGLRDLLTATQDASRDLLESLAPRLEQSFKSLVDLPFERLGEAVERFRAVVDDTADRHERTLTALDGAVSQLTTAQEELASATDAARGCVDNFAGVTTLLRETTGAATEVVSDSRRAADALHATVDSMVATHEQQGALTNALGIAVTELRGTAGALDASASRFQVGAKRLEGAAGRIEQLGSEAAENSVRTMREELQAAADQMAAALKAFGDSNVAAYEASSARVIDALDARVTDLTDRLSAELQTLATRLPESASEITRAAAVLRKQLGDSVRGLEQAVRTVDTGTTQTLTARLAEYDGLVAKAVERFSGTLLTWDGRVRELGIAAGELRTGAVDALREAASAARSATEAARSAAEAARAAHTLRVATDAVMPPDSIPPLTMAAVALAPSAPGSNGDVA